MKKNLLKIIISVVAIFIIGTFYVSLKKTEIYDTKNLVGTNLDNFELNSLNKNLKINQELVKKSQYTLINFWASWCAPCKEEMPSLDLLQSNKNLDNLKIFPINVGQDNLNKATKFFEDLKIKNLELYFDAPNTLAKRFGLRGIPTTILINKDGLEFARIVGSIDFEDQKFIDWLRNYN